MEEAQKRRDWSQVRRLLIAEISGRRGHHGHQELHPTAPLPGRNGVGGSNAVDAERLKSRANRASLCTKNPFGAKEAPEVTHNSLVISLLQWSGWWDLNPRPLRPERSALPS